MVDIERKIEKGASIMWFCAIFAGLVVLTVGLLWFLDLQEIIDIDIWSICSILLILAGIGVIGFAMWLRSMIRD